MAPTPPPPPLHSIVQNVNDLRDAADEAAKLSAERDRKAEELRKETAAKNQAKTSGK